MIEYFFNNIEPITISPVIEKWLIAVAAAENRKIGHIRYIFCDDEEILAINRKFLDHHYETDIITFDESRGSVISGEIFISIETVRDNAAYYNIDELAELYRVMVHGVLHLCRYKDHTDEEKAVMRSKENYYLQLLDVSRETKVQC